MNAQHGDLRSAPVERRDRTDKVAEKIARRILRDIVARGHLPGTKLPSEAVMLQRYDVGRASLREGLRILEVYGPIWIKPGPGGGPVVADVSSFDFGRGATFFYHAAGAQLHELVEARVCVEPMMARLAGERLTDETAEQLRDVLAHEEATLDDASALTEVRSDRFHNVVAGMSGNRVLSMFGQSLVDIYIERIKPVFPVDQRNLIHRTHKAIGDAILKGNGQRAERLMRQHMDDLSHKFTTHFPALTSEVIDWR
jgi:DNA-binding FadR family transcriptional regulator